MIAKCNAIRESVDHWVDTHLNIVIPVFAVWCIAWIIVLTMGITGVYDVCGKALALPNYRLLLRLASGPFNHRKNWNTRTTPTIEPSRL